MSDFIEGGYTGNVSKTPLPVGKKYGMFRLEGYARAECDAALKQAIVRFGDYEYDIPNLTVSGKFIPGGTVGEPSELGLVDGNFAKLIAEEWGRVYERLALGVDRSDKEDALVCAVYAATGKLPELPDHARDDDAITLEKLKALKDKLGTYRSPEFTLEMTPDDVKKLEELFGSPRPDPSIWGAQAYHCGAKRNLTREQRRSLKAAAYQARRYVAKTVKRERRKWRATAEGRMFKDLAQCVHDTLTNVIIESSNPKTK